MTQPRYTDEDYERSFNGFLASIESILKQCDEVRQATEEGSKLLTEARENLSEALKGISLTGDFAKSGLSTSILEGTECEHGAGLVAKAPSPVIDEAERKHYANQHRLEQEYAERFPEE